MADTSAFPRLRPVEVFPAVHEGRDVLLVQDPTGLAVGPIAISPAVLLILSLLDGEKGLAEVQAAFRARSGRSLSAEVLLSLVDQLDGARYLESPRFQEFLEAQAEAYRASATRRSAGAESLGAEEDGLSATLARLLACGERVRPQAPGGRIAGLVAPHLDFERGRCCYADVYGLLGGEVRPRRVVILGTNHFGRASGVVATTKDFETPLGVTRTDRAFIAALQGRCGGDLTRHESDHGREHSVELQVVLLQQVLGAGNFEIVPVLCPDPGASADGDGERVSPRVFAGALGEMVDGSGGETIVVAGADLSHVGRRFGDDRELDASFLEEVERSDRALLAGLTEEGADAFAEGVAARGNRTRICSVGCLYALRAALPRASAELLRYHQAVDAEGGTGVTCASMVWWSG